MTTIIILIVVSLIMIIMAVSILLSIKKIYEEGIKVKGIIFDFTRSVGNMNNNAMYPIVRFLTLENEWITNPGKIGIIPGMYKKGTEVDIVYQKNNPNNFFIRDKLTYVIPSVMLIAALSILGIAIFLLL